MRLASAVVLLSIAASSPLLATDTMFSPDYSKDLGLTSGQMLAGDATGAVYVTDGTGQVVKYASGGDVVWRSNFGFRPVSTASDSAGNLFAVSTDSTTGQLFTGRIRADGTVGSTKTLLGTGLTPVQVIVDPNNRVWVTGSTRTDVAVTLTTTQGAFRTTLPVDSRIHCFLLRLNAAGTAIEYATYVYGSGNDSPSAIAVDPSGAAYMLGMTTSTDFPLTAGQVSGSSKFLLKLKPEGTALVYSIVVPGAGVSGQLVVDANGETTASLSVPIAGPTVVHYRADATLAFTKQSDGYNIGLDAKGNIYSAAAAVRGNHPVKNTTSTCGTSFLNVYSAGGDWLQGTWLPAGAGQVNALWVSSSTVFVAGAISGTAPVEVLTRLSQKVSIARQDLPLGCVTDAAIYEVPGAYAPNQGFYSNVPRGIAPGELVTLFGVGLGPAKGTQPQTVPLPRELAGVQVTFDGTPAPLLYVQDAQINAIAPWGLATGKDSQVCVAYQAVKTNCIPVAIVDSAPAVFTSDGYYAIAANQDGSINSAAQPAAPDSVVTIWATGLGPIRPVLDDGAVIGDPLPANQFSVKAETADVFGIFGVKIVPWEVPYYGPAPGMAAGVSQINLRVPVGESTAVVQRDVYLNVADVVGKLTLFIGSSK